MNNFVQIIFSGVFRVASFAHAFYTLSVFLLVRFTHMDYWLNDINIRLKGMHVFYSS